MQTRRSRWVNSGGTPGKDPLETLVKLLDEAFQIPGTNIRVGWDAIIGLIPGLGEFLMLFAQSGIVVYAVSKYPMPKVVAARMVLNVLIDSTIGSIPFIGDIFDIFYKANTKNLRLLQQVRAHHEQGAPLKTARHTLFLAGVVVALLAIIVGVLALTYFVLQSLWAFAMGPSNQVW